jgi:hypothetical protein
MQLCFDVMGITTLGPPLLKCHLAQRVGAVRARIRGCDAHSLAALSLLSKKPGAWQEFLPNMSSEDAFEEGARTGAARW